MSFCDFAVNVEDAIDQGPDYYQEETKNGEAAPPQLLWLSDIPLFRSLRTERDQPHSYANPNGTEMLGLFESEALRERDEDPYTGFRGSRDQSTTGGGGGGARSDSDDPYGRYYTEDGSHSYFTEDGFVDPYEWADTREPVSTCTHCSQTFASATVFQEHLDGDVHRMRVRELTMPYDEYDDELFRSPREQDLRVDDLRVDDLRVDDLRVDEKAGGRVLEQTPEWYDKYTSVLSTMPPETILLTIAQMLENDDRITFEVSDNTYQIIGTFHLNEASVRFYVNIFADIYDGERLIEFQRHYGSSFDFQEFYRQCLAHLGKIEGFLVEEVIAPSSGIFNFTKDVDGVAAARDEESKDEVVCSSSAVGKALTPPGFNVAKVSEYMDAVTAALNDCVDRVGFTLSDVRNDALRALVLATDELKPVVYEDADLALSILCDADRNLEYMKSNKTEILRCLAAVAANLCCDKPAMSDADKDRVFAIMKGVHDGLVPTLLTFWEDSRVEKCDGKNRETDKQIVRLLGILYNTEHGPGSYGEVTESQLAKMTRQVNARVKSMDDSPRYKRMRDELKQIGSVLNKNDDDSDSEELASYARTTATNGSTMLPLTALAAPTIASCDDGVLAPRLPERAGSHV